MRLFFSVVLSWLHIDWLLVFMMMNVALNCELFCERSARSGLTVSVWYFRKSVRGSEGGEGVSGAPTGSTPKEGSKVESSGSSVRRESVSRRGVLLRGVGFGVVPEKSGTT